MYLYILLAILSVTVATPCEDSSDCRPQNHCRLSSCYFGECVEVEKVCEDKNPCTRNVCDPDKGCIRVYMKCEDDEECAKSNQCPLQESDIPFYWWIVIVILVSAVIGAVIVIMINVEAANDDVEYND